ncbi:YdcF family protein [Stappia sp. F7233]|uniref:YdcF family protein n=1 Tax=Stappia albiluteola TaxID=2758565 RepID=A0A839ADW0_9HYPH|nr:YdcF family protein [Stappia albiluteola]MBA5777970.1 YdcF family protein [Stappia albiluteola]
MFAALAKLGFFLLRPSNFLVLLLVAGLCLLPVGLRRFGLTAIAVAALGLFVGGFSPLANWLMLPLEERFPTPHSLPERIDGIVMLGGAIDTLSSAGRSFPGIERPAERVMVIPRLAARFPEARILLSGGTAGREPDEGEAAIARRLLVEFGVDPARIEIEGRSLDTWQNANESHALAKPKPGETWLLVTSAAHMPRAVGTFRKAGWETIIAYPVDWETSGPQDRARWFRSASMGLTRLDQAVREWIGLAAYWLSGRSSAIFPAPGE